MRVWETKRVRKRESETERFNGCWLRNPAGGRNSAVPDCNASLIRALSHFDTGRHSRPPAPLPTHGPLTCRRAVGVRGWLILSPSDDYSTLMMISNYIAFRLPTLFFKVLVAVISFAAVRWGATVGITSDFWRKSFNATWMSETGSHQDSWTRSVRREGSRAHKLKQGQCLQSTAAWCDLVNVCKCFLASPLILISTSGAIGIPHF